MIFLNMENEIINRLDMYIRTNGLNDHKVTVQCGLSIGALGNARKNGKGISSRNIEKILSTYKDLNARWLLTGEGEMVEVEPSQTDSGTIQLLKEHNRELIEKIEKLSRELGDKERQIAELKKEYAPIGLVADSGDANSYGLKK